MTDTRSLLDAERAQLLDVLDGLDPEAWTSPSLCSAWTIRDVIAHLLMPYELALPALLPGLVRARFSFDRFAAGWATDDPRSASQLVDDLRATRDKKFKVPGASAEAALSHLVCHVEDIYRPLDVERRTEPHARRVVLDQLTTRRGSIRAGLLDGLTVRATDTDWTYGDGATVSGPSSALITTLVGRTAALDELTGDGVMQLGKRLTPPTA